jgi:hypothetical protein
LTSEVIDSGVRTFDSRPADQFDPNEGEHHDRRQTIANRYIDLWNERTPARRREILAANWATDARYAIP